VDFSHLGDYALSVVEADELARLEAAARDVGEFVRAVRIEEGVTESSLINALGKALEFPDYFGMNWDAVGESMEDLDSAGKNVTLIIWNGERLLGLECFDLITFIRVLVTVDRFWKEQGKTFRTVLSGSRRLYDTIEKMLRPI